MTGIEIFGPVHGLVAVEEVALPSGLFGHPSWMGTLGLEEVTFDIFYRDEPPPGSKTSSYCTLFKVV